MATLDAQTINCLNSVISVNGHPEFNAQLAVWNTSNATPFTMTYQFAGAAQPGDWDPGWNPNGVAYTGWTAMTGNEQTAIRAALDEYQSVANVLFNPVTGQADPDVNFGKVTLPGGEDGVGGWNFSVSWDGNGNLTSKTMDHFAVFSNAVDVSTGHSNLLLHEIGHSMTMRHPGNYDVGGNPPPAPYLPADQDNNKYTVMSYNADPDNGQFNDHLGVYDIAALQARWGANMSWHTGNDVYTGPNGNMQCIWDAGGTDTFDASARTTAVSINLHEGAFSSIGATNNLSIAYGAVIENAKGGSGADTLIGNDGANVLQGNGGNDIVDGAGGTDLFVLSGARAQYAISNVTATSVTLTNATDGSDTVNNVENFQFSDGTFTFAQVINPPAPAGSVSIGDAQIVEGDNGTQNLIFTVLRSGGTAAFNVNYATSDGTATTADGDYVGTSGTLVFGVNDTQKTFTVTINGDTKVEANEAFNVSLSNATNGATIADGLGVGNITNDDTSGSVAIGDAQIVEGNNGTQTLFFTVLRSGGTAPFSVNYATADGTATAADGDYAVKSGTLNFLANETSKTIGITINGDTKLEANESFFVNLSGATNSATISDGQGVGTITNDESTTVNSSVSYTLGPNELNLILTGNADTQGYGNAVNNVITGNSGNNLIDGGAGGDSMFGGAGNDVYYVDNAGDGVVENPNEGNDSVFSTVSFTLGANVENLILQGSADLQGYGNADANVIYGNAGNNLLNGGAGADLMAGGAGNDIYYVDNAGDVAFESAGQGNDAVFSTVSYGLAADVESLILQGNADLQGYGNNQANTIYGNAGNNLINAGGGADLMAGGAGNDVYYVDNAGDVAFESAGQGNDSVFSTASFGLAADVENLILQGNADLQGYGNNQANVIYGNNGNNLLNGGGGADQMVGGAGNDVYFVDNAGDSVVEAAGQGNDSVFASVTYTLGANVEGLVLQGTAAINGTGNAIANSLVGNSGANVLDGGAAADQFTGNAGDDTFVFRAGQAGGDTVVDFTGNGANAGDSLSFVGFGSAAQGASFTQMDVTHWQIHSGLDGHNEVITLSNGAAVHATDYFFS